MGLGPRVHLTVWGFVDPVEDSVLCLKSNENH